MYMAASEKSHLAIKEDYDNLHQMYDECSTAREELREELKKLHTAVNLRADDSEKQRKKEMQEETKKNQLLNEKIITLEDSLHRANTKLMAFELSETQNSFLTVEVTRLQNELAAYKLQMMNQNKRSDSQIYDLKEQLEVAEAMLQEFDRNCQALNQRISARGKDFDVLVISLTNLISDLTACNIPDDYTPSCLIGILESELTKSKSSISELKEQKIEADIEIARIQSAEKRKFEIMNAKWTQNQTEKEQLNDNLLVVQTNLKKDLQCALDLVLRLEERHADNESRWTSEIQDKESEKEQICKQLVDLQIILKDRDIEAQKKLLSKGDELKFCAEKIAELNSQASSLEKNIQQIRAQNLAQLKSQDDSYCAKIFSAEGEIGALKLKIDSLERTKQSLTDIQKKSKEELQQSSLKFNSSMYEASESIKQLETRIFDLEDQIKIKDNFVDSSNTEHKSSLNRCQMQISEAASVAEAQRIEIVALLHSSKNEKIRIAELELLNSDLKSDFERQVDELKKCIFESSWANQAQMNLRDTEIKRCQGNSNEMNDLILVVEGELAVARKNLVERETALTNAEIEQNRMKDAIKQLKSELAETNSVRHELICSLESASKEAKLELNREQERNRSRILELNLLIQKSEFINADHLQALAGKEAEFQLERGLIEKQHLANVCELNEKIALNQSEVYKAASTIQQMKHTHSLEITEAKFQIASMNEAFQQLVAESNLKSNQISQSAREVYLLTEKVEKKSSDQLEERKAADTHLSKIKSENTGLLSKIESLVKLSSEEKRMTEAKEEALLMAKSKLDELEASILDLTNDLAITNVPWGLI